MMMQQKQLLGMSLTSCFLFVASIFTEFAFAQSRQGRDVQSLSSMAVVNLFFWSQTRQ